MPADRLLNTVLQYYQDVHDAPRTEQIIGTTTHLLTQLSNPLNLGVLTSQFLTARAIWQRPEGLRTAIRIISIYNTAASRVREFELDGLKAEGPREGGGLRCAEWTRAVIKGADDRSKRWQHLLVLTGVLMGMEGNDKRTLGRTLRHTVQDAVVTAANLALETHVADGPLAGASIVLALNFVFPLLSEQQQLEINCDALLPIAIWAMTGEEGFCDAHFIEAIGRETTVTPNGALHWDAGTFSFYCLKDMERGPLMGNMGPLAKLAAFAVQHAKNTSAVLQAQDALLLFSRRSLEAWQRSPFGDIDPATENTMLSLDTTRNTWPLLIQVLKKLLFGAVSLLQAIVSRSLLDKKMLKAKTAPGVASRSLHILRNLSFISSRDGNNSFQVYTFSYLTSLDMLGRYPAAAEKFLREARPGENPGAPARHIQRTLDLFYLNVAEHLPMTISTAACDELIVKPALAYLSHDGPMTPAMVEVFESAHCAVLAVLSAPHNSTLTIGMAPFYIVKLFESFPRQISARQFRVAFKTVMQIVSPPFPIAATEPHLSETLLEMLRGNISNATVVPLPAPTDANGANQPQEPMSEQSALVLALIDSLPHLPLPLVEEWLTIGAQALNEIADPHLREPVKKRFWEVLVSGEMDVERAAIGVAWWGTKGGRELVLFGSGGGGSGGREMPIMSGALVNEEKLSKL